MRCSTTSRIVGTGVNTRRQNAVEIAPASQLFSAISRSTADRMRHDTMPADFDGQVVRGGVGPSTQIVRLLAWWV